MHTNANAFEWIDIVLTNKYPWIYRRFFYGIFLGIEMHAIYFQTFGSKSEADRTTLQD